MSVTSSENRASTHTFFHLATIILLSAVLICSSVFAGATLFSGSGTDHPYYAQAATKKITVRFDANGGKTTVKQKKIATGKTYGTLPKATRKGFYFQGWYTKRSGGKKVTSASPVAAGQNRTFYAHWSRVPAKFMNAIGKRFTSLKKQEKKLVYTGGKGGIDIGMQCMWNPSKKYRYIGYYTQVPPNMVELTEKQRLQLYCVGIDTDLGTLFPGMKSGISIHAFFDWLGVERYEYPLENSIDPEAMIFTYQGCNFEVINIGTTTATTMKASYIVSMTTNDGSIMRKNYSLMEKYLYRPLW